MTVVQCLTNVKKLALADAQRQPAASRSIADERPYLNAGPNAYRGTQRLGGGIKK